MAIDAAAAQLGRESDVRRIEDQFRMGQGKVQGVIVLGQVR